MRRKSASVAPGFSQTSPAHPGNARAARSIAPRLQMILSLPPPFVVTARLRPGIDRIAALPWIAIARALSTNESAPRQVSVSNRSLEGTPPR